MKKITALFLCVCLLCVCMSGCTTILERRTVVSDTDAEVTPSDSQSVSGSDIGIDYTGYVVPEEEGLEYSPWDACEGSYTAFASQKLLDMAGMASSLCGYEETLKEYRSPEAMMANTGYSRLLNDIRAWRFGAQSYPAETLSSEKEQALCSALVTLGDEAADFAAALPAYILTSDASAIAGCENAVLGCIAELQALITE